MRIEHVALYVNDLVKYFDASAEKTCFGRQGSLILDGHGESCSESALHSGVNVAEFFCEVFIEDAHS